jgi:putative membrane protein
MLSTILGASAHHILAFLLIAILSVELTLVRPGMSLADRRMVGRVDAAYGLVALALLLMGLWRAYALEKGMDFYLSSPWFWLKLGTFLVVGLLSVPPTLRFRAWGRLGDALPPPDEIRSVRNWMHAQAALLLIVPVAAALMARGY